MKSNSGNIVILLFYDNNTCIVNNRYLLHRVMYGHQIRLLVLFMIHNNMYHNIKTILRRKFY